MVRRDLTVRNLQAASPAASGATDGGTPHADVTVEVDFAHQLGEFIRLAQTFAKSGDFEKANAAYNQALALTIELKNDKQHARVLRLRGNLFLLKGRYRRAIKIFNRSLRISRKIGDSLEEAYGLNSLACVHFQHGDWRNMERVCNRIFGIATNHPLEPLYACASNNLGVMYCLRSQWDQALACFQKSLPLFELIGDIQGVAETCNNLANVYREKRFWRESAKYFANSLHYARLVGDEHTKANATLNRAELYRDLNDLTMAKRICSDALEMYQQLDDPYGLAEAFKTLGSIHSKMEQCGEAKKCFQRAIEIFVKMKNLHGLAESFLYCAELYIHRNKYRDASACLQHSLRCYRKLRLPQKIAELEKRIEQVQQDALA